MDSSPAVYTAGGVVDSAVGEVASSVFEGVLDGGDAQHEDKRQHRHLLPEGVHGRHEV